LVRVVEGEVVAPRKLQFCWAGVTIDELDLDGVSRRDRHVEVSCRAVVALLAHNYHETVHLVGAR